MNTTGPGLSAVGPELSAAGSGLGAIGSILNVADIALSATSIVLSTTYPAPSAYSHHFIYFFQSCETGSCTPDLQMGTRCREIFSVTHLGKGGVEIPTLTVSFQRL